MYEGLVGFDVGGEEFKVDIENWRWRERVKVGYVLREMESSVDTGLGI